MGRYLLLFILVVAGYINLDARQFGKEKNRNQLIYNQAGSTTIYLVRHAEKETRNPSEQDPDLTEVGQKRAQALKAYLEDVPVDAFFSTPYKRNQQTLAPLAQGRPLQFYESHDYTLLRDKILSEHKGKTVVVVGHSNTLLPIIEAFGAKKPIKEITDRDYDNIFKLTILPKGKAKVEAGKFGAQSTLAAGN
ncbi:phosphoglycerate mutase family protein [Adhaeribacter rhizoryzae]|uniref:Histidine phosphatase family protein n=1 Tax=Adhaeribacter rhizoryzae TaxID=2607907 RepID=A0A5M6DM79_9BACT|nr:phosphoglycerate mutase family protein [Adhaeribacter rhizoryzae]KAA5548631.1 histidine phosphatase family protein [Adhaeribacter rhizoryzae]